MNVTLRQLRAFMKVAETGSFTEAARDLNLTQSALSGQIRDLEAALGVTVLDRTTRQVMLSDVGAEFLPSVSQVVEDLDRSFEALTARKFLRSGRVSLAAPQLLACTLIPKLIGEFLSDHPGVQFVLRDVGSDEILEQVRDGSSDIAIGGERNNLHDIDSELLFELPFMAAMRADHPLADRDTLTWRDVTEQKVISPKGSFLMMLNADLQAAGTGMSFRDVIEVSYFSTAISLVSEGLGITICQPYATPLLNLYGLKHHMIQDPPIHRRFYLYTRKDRSLSPAAAKVADHLRRSRDHFQA